MENEQGWRGADGRICLARLDSQARTGTGKHNFLCSADNEQRNWQPLPAYSFSALSFDQTYINTYTHTYMMIYRIIVRRFLMEHEIYLSSFAPKNLVSRDKFGSPVPCQPVHSPHSDRIWCLLTGFLLPLSAMVFIYTVNRHWFSPKFLHRWFHCRESTGTGPVILTIA